MPSTQTTTLLVVATAVVSGVTVYFANKKYNAWLKEREEKRMKEALVRQSYVEKVAMWGKIALAVTAVGVAGWTFFKLRSYFPDSRVEVAEKYDLVLDGKKL